MYGSLYCCLGNLNPLERLLPGAPLAENPLNRSHYTGSSPLRINLQLTFYSHVYYCYKLFFFRAWEVNEKKKENFTWSVPILVIVAGPQT